MWAKSFWQWILRRLGIDKSTATTDNQREVNHSYTAEYQDISKINFTAIFAKKLAMLATSDSGFTLEEVNARSKLLADVGGRVWKGMRKTVSMALGCGGVLIVPYVKNGRLCYDRVTQDRLSVNAMDGDRITNATVIADTIVINSVRYVRTVNYIIQNNVLYITNVVSTADGRTASVDEWRDISDITIAGVDRVPFGYIKCPADNRRCDDDYGVPVTFGAKPIIEEIEKTLKQISEEYRLKKVKLQVDERCFRKDSDGKLIIKDDVFITGFNGDNKNMFNIFDPVIRDSSFYNRLEELFDELEKCVGTSRGFLTESVGTYENVEAIRAANRDTWAYVTAIRDAIADAMEDFLYICNVYANAFNLSPIGEYDFSFDWDSSLIESTDSTWQHMKDLQGMGAMKKAELRAWETGEDLETAQSAVDEIAKTEPDMRTLMGMGE